MKEISNRRIIHLCLALVLCTLIGVCTVFAAGAEEADGVSFSSTDFYQMDEALPDFTAFTFETEFYVPADFSGRAYNFIGNWATSSSSRDGNEWNIELHNNGSVRLFHTNGGSVYFNTNGSANTGTATDYRIYMKDENGNPTYVKMAITVDVAAGNAYLYMNGKLVGSIENNSTLKKFVYTASSKNPKHRIGFDYRDDTNLYFKGKIRNMAMYNYVRTADQIAADATAFAPSATDSGLMFAYNFAAAGAASGYVPDLSSNGNNANLTNWTTDEGRSFSADDKLFVTKTLAEMPRTYEAWIWAPITTNRSGLLMGNYGSGNRALVNFEIYSSGRPSVYIKDEDGNLMDTKFEYDIRRNSWAHLVITHEALENGGSRFNCWVDGKLVDSFDKELSYEFNPTSLTSLQLGGDSRSENAHYYKGRIKSLALYSDVLTEAEIVSSYTNGINTAEDSLLCHYELDGTDGAVNIKDKSAAGIDLQPIFYENDTPLELGKDYAYSFAVVGDTQKLIYNDTYNGTSYVSYIYDWLAANKDKKNIQMVMGLGDITEKNGKDATADDGIDQTDLEWTKMVKEFEKLEAVNLAYTLVQGNHDSVAQLDKFFSTSPNFTEADIGYYSGTSLGNYYVRFTAGSNKYMVVVLEYGPNDKMLTWAGNAIAANPDHQVIITTHAYMFRDGTTLDIGDVVPPRTNTESTDPTADNYDNNGDQIWTKLVSQYPNVILALGGHDPCADIITRTDLGVHGNTVYQMLIDPQGMDASYGFKTGMVAMFYFSADGKQVKVEYVSTYNSLEAQKADPTSPDVLFHESINLFSFEIPEAVELDDVTVSINGTDGYVIPGYYSNEVTYPFVVFKTDKTFIGGYGDLGAANAAAKAKGTAGNYVILMRRDAEQNTKASGLATMTGSITVDLGGYTLYKTGVGYIFDMYVNDNSSSSVDENGIDARGTFSIINGTVVSSDAYHPLACVNYGPSLAKNVSINFVFDNVTFIDVVGGYHILATWENGYSSVTGDAKMLANVTFNDCTFDYVSSADSVSMIYMINKDGYDRVVFNVALNGGKIISAEPTYFLNFVQADGNTNGRADVITFGKGSDGNYVQQLVPTGIDTSSYFDTWTDTAGDWHFEQTGSDAKYDIFSLAEGEGGDITESPNYTEYGWIPTDYLDATVYPILLFQNGTFVGGYGVFANGNDSGGVMSQVKALLDGNADGEKGATVQIYFRSNATATGILPNVGQILGNVIVDLNGFTLTQTYTSNALLNTQAKYWKGMEDATFTFINGSIELKTNLLHLGAYGTGYAGAEGMKTFNLSFNNVKFFYSEGATATEFLGKYSDAASTNGKSVGYNVEFNNCIFDFSGVSTITAFINANDTVTGIEGDTSTTGTNCIISVTVKGGEIISSAADLLWYEIGTNGSSVYFEKSEEGKLTSLTLTSDAESIKHGVVSSLGELGFVKTSADENGSHYSLVSKALADVVFTPMASITLDRDLILNVYVPVTDVLTALEFAGSTVDLASLELTTVNGASYYVIRTPLAASSAAGELSMKATLTAEGISATKSYAFGVIRYAEIVLAGDNDAEKTLVKNVLSYVRAAYAYFGTEDATAIAQIDAILGEGYDESNAYVADDNTEASTTGLKGATLVLDATPAIRFYLADGIDASAYEFYAGGRRVKTVTGTDTNGAYVELDVYAYAMIRTVTYTVNGAEGGTYHINSYYEFVKTDAEHKDNAKLINLVARFAKYCESAAAYRAEVLSALGCSHNYVDGTCTECGAADPDYVPEDHGTMDLTVPSSIYSNYPARDVTVTFSKEYNGTVTYTTDNANVFVENGKIYATGIFSAETVVTVTATTEHHTATATVKVSTYNGNINAETKVQYYEANIIKEENKGGMIFVGDSYVDGYTISAPPFWRDFYQDYAGKKAFLMGLSSSQIHQLEIVSERIVYPMEPAEIVVNIGHNDLHHGSLTVDQFIERLTALLNEYHERLPEAKIYFMGVAPKKAAETNEDRFVSSFEEAPAANAAIKALADELDWLYYVDTASIFYSYGENLVNENMFPGNDASHPSLTSYDLMRIALDKVRGAQQDDVIYINNLDKSIGVNAAGKTFTDASGNPLTTDFAMSGKLVITQLVKNNAHLHFRFGSGHRFVLWDQSNDGVFGAGYIGSGGSASDKATGVLLYNSNEGLVINWTVILKDGVAYWYINGQLVQMLENLNLQYFNIGAECINAVLYDIDLNVKAEDEAAYNAHVARYSDDVVNFETYGYGSTITSKVFTDASGNALTDNYVIKGKLDISAFPKDNVYIQFRFGSSDRFLLWDSDNDGKLGAGYTENGTHVSDKTSGINLYDAREGLTLDWAIVVKNGAAYWYLNGNLEKKLAAPKLEGFSIGVVEMNVLFSDIEIITKAEDEAAYNAAIANYPTGLSFSIEMYEKDGDITSNGKTLTDSTGAALTNNYIVSGTLSISEMRKNNAHLQFRVGSGCRFLLWDSNGDGVLGVGYMHTNNGSASDKTEGAKLYDANDGLTLDWAVIVHDSVAYLYINGELEWTISNPTLDSFNVGALQMNVYVSNVEVCAKAEGADVYYNGLTRYFDNVVNIQKYGQNGDISASGKTFTDASGNALKNNYVVRGTMDITAVNKSNAHLQFRFGSGCRFLLWDSDSDGVFGVGYSYNGNVNDTTAGAKLIDANGGATLEWAIVVNEGVAYWYLNGELVQKFDSPKLELFNVGALQMNVFLSNIELYVKAENAEAYNAVLAEYQA